MSEQRTDNKVQLGCGTLIVIALIVMLFSGGRDSKNLRQRVDELNQKIDHLETKIDALSQKIDPPCPPQQTTSNPK